MSQLLERIQRFRYWIYAALIAVAYASSLEVTYYFDDIHSILDNSALRDLSNWYRYWVDPSLTSSLAVNRSYRPMTFMIYNLLMVAGDGSPVPFHLHKLLLLFGICVAIGKIWGRLVPGRPLFGVTLACLWAVHPALSESAIYLTATSSLQAAFFYFWAFWFYVRSPQSFLPVVACYAASCFSKEEGITLPAILALYEWLQGDLRKSWKPIAACSLFGALLFVFIQTRIPAEQSVSRGPVPPLHYLYTQIRGWVHYQWLWLWPAELNADNASFGFSSSWKEPRVLGCFFLQLAITIVLFVRRRAAPLLLFGWLWYYLSISPASSVIPLAEPVNERRMIIAYLGFTGAIHWLADRLLARAKAGAVLAGFVALLLALTLVTRERVRVWREPYALWTDVVEKNPGHVRGLNNLASEMITRGDYERALGEIRKCLSLSPYIYCLVNEGIANTQLHRYAEARSAFERAIARDPKMAVAHYYFARYWFDLREYDRALSELDESLRLSAGTHRPSIELRARVLEAKARR